MVHCTILPVQVREVMTRNVITPAPLRCNHSMDVGVRCLPFIQVDACAVPSQGATTESSITQGTVMSTSGTLVGALIGLLAAALVVLGAVLAGWIVSCVYLQQKINK